MSFSDIGIATRLKLGFGMVLGLSGVLALVAYLQLQNIGEVVRSINDDWTVSVVDLNEMRDGLAALRRSELRYALSGDAEHETEDAQRATVLQQMEAPRRRYEATGISGPEERRIYDRYVAALKMYEEGWPRVRDLLRAGPSARAQAVALVFGDSAAQFDAAKRTLADDVAFNVTGAAKMKVTAADTLTDATRYIVGTLGAILLSGGVFAWWLGRSITAPMSNALTWAKTIAAGNLSTSVPTTATDETGQLLKTLGDMQSTLKRMILGIRASADEVSTASTQIATGNSDLSARTEQQASNLQETAASVEQLTSTVVSSESNVRRAQDMAGSAMEIASAGGAAVSRVSGTMSGISSSSKKIADIIGVIDGIAFQTNILALNAAVEAARAGEQGRGFAVVASEVRTLAQRSAQAAKEIKALIQESVERVGEGDALVGDASKTMTQIVEAVQQVVQRLAEISNTASEQAAGIQQVHAAVTRLDEATQQNAALVEQSAAASEGLKDQAARLAESVAQFRLETA